MIAAILLCLAFLCGIGVAAPTEAEKSSSFNTLLEGGVSAERTQAQSLKVISWNIHSGRHLEQVVATLQGQKPDICLLQEVDVHARRTNKQHTPEELARRLKMKYVFGVEFEELSQGSPDRKAYIGQAILTSLPVRQSRIIRFSEQSGFWKPRSFMPSSLPFFQRRLGGRIALVTELDFHGHLLVFYNLHLESRNWGRLQYRQLKEVLADADHYPSGTSIILAGDLNTKYKPSFFVNRLRRAGFRNSQGDKIARTHILIGSLDWIFIRGTLRIEEGKVLKGAKGSDHFPVFAKVGSEQIGAQAQ